MYPFKLEPVLHHTIYTSKSKTKTRYDADDVDGDDADDIATLMINNSASKSEAIKAHNLYMLFIVFQIPQYFHIS